jgi:hypothetical protein
MAQIVRILVSDRDRTRTAAVVVNSNRPQKRVRRARTTLLAANRVPAIDEGHRAGASRLPRHHRITESCRNWSAFPGSDQGIMPLCQSAIISMVAVRRAASILLENEADLRFHVGDPGVARSRK